MASSEPAKPVSLPIKILRIVMPIVAIASVIIFPPWDAIWLWLQPLPDSVQQEVDQAIEHGLDGIIVYVDQAGEAEGFYAAGWKDRANQVPADPHALFKIASISKLYIAAAAAKLVHDASLALDDTLAMHVPEVVGRIEHAEQITLRMLLQHRSGIPNFTDQPAFDWAKPSQDISENLQLVFDLPADFAPDTAYAYSNTNFLLIGRILDTVLGYSHHEYIRNEILMPLQLNSTYSLLDEVRLDDIVSGYYVGYEDDLKEIDYVIPGGSMVATAQDTGVFLRALIDGTLLYAEEQEIYTSIYPYHHTGWLLGYQSIAQYHEDIDTVVIQFVSSTGGNTNAIAGFVYNRVVQIVRNR